MTMLEEMAIAEMRKDPKVSQYASDEDILIALKGLAGAYVAYLSIEFEEGAVVGAFFDDDDVDAASIALKLLYDYGEEEYVDTETFLDEEVMVNQTREDFLADIMYLL